MLLRRIALSLALSSFLASPALAAEGTAPPWQQNATALYTDAKKVGIGTSAPSEQLEVHGKIKIVGDATCILGGGRGATNCTSDARLKDRIAIIPDALAKVTALRGVTFHWKDAAKSGPEHIGVIAQDVEAQFPQIVTQVDGVKAVDQSALVAPLIEAVKQLSRELTLLRTEFTAYRQSHP